MDRPEFNFTRTDSPVEIPMIQTTPPPEDEAKLLKAAENYSLPPAVKLAVNTDLKQANAFPLITALFAGGLLTLAQMVPADHPDDAAWRAFGFFIYSAVFLNLSGTFLCLMAIKMCTDLPHTAQQMVLSDLESWPSKVASGKPLPREYLTNHWLLLSNFGMSWRYRWLDALFVFVVLFGGLYTFVAVTLWVWLIEPHVVAAVIMLSILPAVACMVYGLVAACSGEGWH